MYLGNVTNLMQMAYRNANISQKNSIKNSSFADSLQEVKDANISKVDEYKEHLKSKFGEITVMPVGSDQSSMDKLGAGTSGYGNVVIAPNILEQMANDPEKAAYYEEKIQHHFDTIPETEAFMASIGHVTTSCGVVIHEDGKVTYYLSGEESPEKKAKFEAAQKEKREEKAAKRKENLERSKEAYEKRKNLLELQYRDELIDKMRNGKTVDNMVDFRIVGGNSTVEPVTVAYEQAISVLSSNIM